MSPQPFTTENKVLRNSASLVREAEHCTIIAHWLSGPAPTASTRNFQGVVEGQPVASQSTIYHKCCDRYECPTDTKGAGAVERKIKGVIVALFAGVLAPIK